MAIVTFTRHFKYYLLGKKLKIVTDDRALQWLHNFKDPDGLTARWLEKLAAFDCEVQHRPGKKIGRADGLSRIPSVQVTSSQSKEKPDESVKTKLFELVQKIGNLFESKDSLAHCISSEFKMSAGFARSFKRKFPYKFPGSTNSPLFVQRLDDRFIYHLVTKKRFFFQKPTYDSLRQSLEAMTNHANKHKISMPKAGYGLEGHKNERLIKEICAQSNLTITVYDQSKEEQSQKQDKTPVRSALGQAQRGDEALSKLNESIEK